MSAHENKSDVARLLRQIDEANEAAMRALHGLAEGSARHDFIQTKMEHIGECHIELTELVGKDEATMLLCQTLEQGCGEDTQCHHDDNSKGGRALTDTTHSDLFTRFQQRLTTAGGESHQVADLAEAAEIIVTHSASMAGEIVVPPGFGQHQQWGAILPLLSRRGITVREAGSPASVADAPAGLSGGELAVAETGSVLLAENTLAARVVSMLTLAHFVLIDENKLVPMLNDAAVVLQQLSGAGADQRRYMSFLTGPSRTADIERTLTIGVQGPKELCVVIVADKEGAKP